MIRKIIAEGTRLLLRLSEETASNSSRQNPNTLNYATAVLRLTTMAPTAQQYTAG